MTILDTGSNHSTHSLRDQLVRSRSNPLLTKKSGHRERIQQRKQRMQLRNWKFLVDYRRRQAEFSARSLVRLSALTHRTNNEEEKGQQQQQQQQSSSSLQDDRPSQSLLACGSEHSIQLGQIFNSPTKIEDNAEQQEEGAQQVPEVEENEVSKQEKIDFLLRNPRVVRVVHQTLHRNDVLHRNTARRGYAAAPIKRREIKCVVENDKYALPKAKANEPVVSSLQCNLTCIDEASESASILDSTQGSSTVPGIPRAQMTNLLASKDSMMSSVDSFAFDSDEEGEDADEEDNARRRGDTEAEDETTRHPDETEIGEESTCCPDETEVGEEITTSTYARYSLTAMPSEADVGIEGSEADYDPTETEADYTENAAEVTEDAYDDDDATELALIPGAEETDTEADETETEAEPTETEAEDDEVTESSYSESVFSSCSESAYSCTESAYSCTESVYESCTESVCEEVDDESVKYNLSLYLSTHSRRPPDLKKGNEDATATTTSVTENSESTLRTSMKSDTSCNDSASCWQDDATEDLQSTDTEEQSSTSKIREAIKNSGPAQSSKRRPPRAMSGPVVPLSKEERRRHMFRRRSGEGTYDALHGVFGSGHFPSKKAPPKEKAIDAGHGKRRLGRSKSMCMGPSSSPMIDQSERSERSDRRRSSKERSARRLPRRTKSGTSRESFVTGSRIKKYNNDGVHQGGGHGLSPLEKLLQSSAKASSNTGRSSKRSSTKQSAEGMSVSAASAKKSCSRQ